MKTRALLRATAILIGAMSVAACGSAPDGGDSSKSSEEAMTCRPGQSCGQPACDPATACCFAGGQTFGASDCGTALYQAGCRGTNHYRPTFAYAVETDGTGHWWFEAYCPSTAGYVVNDPRCANEVYFNFGGNMCTVSSPGAGQVDVIYDPYCPSGCGVAVQ